MAKQQNSRQDKSNRARLNSALHGTSYHVKLGIVVSLANAKKVSDATDKFNFTVTADDPTAGKFDDIVYTFNDGGKTGTLKISVKHTFGYPTRKINLRDFTTTRDVKNPFAILKYFTSVYDQPTKTVDMEGLVICTNSDLDDDARELWKPVRPVSTCDSLDSFVSKLFNKAGGKCYRLDFDTLTDGTVNELYQACRKYSKCTRLVKLLVNAIESEKHRLTRQNPILMEYRRAILNIIDSNDTSETGSFKFTEQFLDWSMTNSVPGYEEFRLEFEEEYEKAHVNNFWGDLKNKRIHVAEDFLLDVHGSDILNIELINFPTDDVDKYLTDFCQRFYLVCDTKNENELDGTIAELWRDMHTERCFEENIVSEKLFRANFDSLIDPLGKSLNSEDIKKDLEKIKNTLDNMNLKGISDKLRETVGSSFRIRPDALKSSELYMKIECENLLEIETCNIQFGLTLLLDIMVLQNKDLNEDCLLLDGSDFINDFEAAKDVFHCTKNLRHLIIIDNEVPRKVKYKVREWKEDILANYTKQVLLIKKSNSMPTNFSCFRICNLTNESRKQFFSQEIPLCTTRITPSKLFQHNFESLSVEEVIQLIDLGKQMKENNNIMRNYQQIESSYVRRYWTDYEKDLPAENLDRSHTNIIADVLKYMRERQKNNVSFTKITELIKNHPNFETVFPLVNNREDNKPILSEGTIKIAILLGEAGYGKSTNLTWLAWDLQNRNPSSWVVRCNLSDHCSDFRRFLQYQRIIDKTEVMRMLYKLVCSSLQLELEIAEKCSKCLVLSNGEASVIEDLMKKHYLSLNDFIQLLVFKEKFNAGELVLLLDGFDEIAPHYKEVVLMLLSHFEQLKGVRKLYVTSRPYGFKEHFEMVFKNPKFFQLKPLSLTDKGFMLFVMIKERFHNKDVDDEQIVDLFKTLCFTLLSTLHELSDVALNLKMSVDLFVLFAAPFIDFPSKTINLELFEEIEKTFKPSSIVEEFVKIKIRLLLYDKCGTDSNVADNPLQIKRFEKATEQAKLLHGLLALWELFKKSELDVVLSDTEKHEAQDYMKNIHEAKEKSGIINEIREGVPIFIHRSFAEYLAAYWVVQRQLEGKRQGMIKICCLESFWDEERRKLRWHIDRMLANRYPLHVAIIERDWKMVESLLSTNPKLIYERDDGNRTPLHLLTLYYNFNHNWPHFLPTSIKLYIMNVKEKIFAWTPLDYAFRTGKSQMIFYLLHHGASINVDVLLEQVVSAGKDKIRKAAKYATHVMGYLSREAFEYQSHDASKKMNQFCDKIIAYSVNETSANLKKLYNPDNKMDINDLSYEMSIMQDILKEDSAWMLESVIQQTTRKIFFVRKIGKKSFVRMIWNSYFELVLKKKSIFVVKYCMTNDSSILCDEFLWELAAYAAIMDCKIEFKYFFDLSCSRFKIKNFKSSEIQRDKPGYLNDNSIVFCSMHIIRWAQLRIPSEIMIDENILSLLVICVATVRPSMQRYLMESCKLNLCAGLVYSLATVTNNLFSKITDKTAIKPSKAYEALLDLASNISDVQANKMIRLAITSNLFEFSKCLIERYNIDYQAVDDLNGWNVFHLCVSNHQLFRIEEMAAGDTRASFVDDDYTDLFRNMLVRANNMDCFGILDKKGRSILHLAMENEEKGIVEYIVSGKLDLNALNEIRNLTIDAIPNIIFCLRAVQEISKSVGEEGWHYYLLCMLAKQIAKISLTNREELKQQKNCRLLLQENAKKLYQIAMKDRSLFLMYYLYCEFPSAIPPLTYDADWLVCTARGLYSKDFFAVTKWLLNPYEMDEHVNLYEVVENCDDEEYDLTSVNLEKLVKQVEAKLSAYRTVEEMCKLKLLTLAVCQKNESMIRNVCETFNVNIYWKILIDIMEIAHQSHIDVKGTQETYGCAFEKPDFVPIYKYLFERTSNLSEIDAEGCNVLHLAAQYGLGCMAKFLIKHNKVNVTTTNEQNGWNIFHYFASRKSSWKCCYTENDELMVSITIRVKDKIKELCFNSNEGRKSVIHVAVEADNIRTVEYIIECSFGIDRIDQYEIRNSDEGWRFRECYDELSQIAAQLPFNGKYDYLLHKLAKLIHRFSPENIEHITEQENVEDYIIEDGCRTAIKRRSVLTLEHLMIACEDQMNQALAGSTSRELVVCMTECIRRNRTSMFKVLVGHYRTSQGIEPRVGVEFKQDENENIDDVTINEDEILWHLIDQLWEDVAMNRAYLSLLILSIAYGRLPMTRFLVEMLQLEIYKSLILLIMKGLKDLWDQNCKVATPVCEYLASRCEGKHNLLHLSVQAECGTMLEYLIKEKKLDPNEIDSENGWNAGHYCVSLPSLSGYDEFTWLVEENNIDCFGVYDRRGRSILQLALENGHIRVVKYIVKHRLGIKSDNEPWIQSDFVEMEEQINKLHLILESLPQSIPLQNQQVIQKILANVRDRRNALKAYYQLFTNQQ